MKIKKVDDKPLVIHTKQKAKLHTHEPKQASIKGNNIYTVDRDPTKKNKDNGDFRKSTVHQVQKEGMLSKYRKNVKESGQSIKVKNHSLRSVGMAGGKAMTDQMEGGQELQQASMIMYEASKPVTGTASRGADLFKRQVLEKQKLKIKKVNAGKKIGKKTAKNTAKHVVKKTSKKAAKETAKTVAKETSKIAAKTATTVATTAAGTAVAPGVGTAIGIAAGEVAGEAVAFKIEKQDMKNCKYKGYNKEYDSYNVIRLGRVSAASIEKNLTTEEMKILQKMYEYSKECWCTSGVGEKITEIVIEFCFDEEKEFFILNRIIAEGHGGMIEKKAPGVYEYHLKIKDPNGMIPWIRSFGERAKVISSGDKRTELLILEDWKKVLENRILFDETENKYYEFLAHFLREGDAYSRDEINKMLKKYLSGEPDFEVTEALLEAKEGSELIFYRDKDLLRPVLSSQFPIRNSVIENQAYIQNLSRLKRKSFPNGRKGLSRFKRN